MSTAVVDEEEFHENDTALLTAVQRIDQQRLRIQALKFAAVLFIEYCLYFYDDIRGMIAL